MEKRKWITTEQMFGILKNEPDNEQEYTHYLGGILRSTHWLIYDSKKDLIGDSSDWRNYSWYTETEFLNDYAGQWWHRDVWFRNSLQHIIVELFHKKNLARPSQEVRDDMF